MTVQREINHCKSLNTPDSVTSQWWTMSKRRQMHTILHYFTLTVPLVPRGLEPLECSKAPNAKKSKFLWWMSATTKIEIDILRHLVLSKCT